MLSIRLAAGVTAFMAFSLGAAFAAGAAPIGNVVAEVPQIQAISDLGHAPLTGVMSIALTLNYRNSDTLEGLVVEQSDPSSPMYGRFLTNEQFNAYFAPTPATYARVVATLQNSGFQIRETYPNATVVDAVGTVAAVNRFFATDIHLVSARGQGIRYANALPAHEPAALRGLVLSVSGLQTLTVNHVAIARVTPNAGMVPLAAGSPLFGPVSSATGAAGYGPLAFAQGYLYPEQFKNASGKYYDGKGRASGIVIDADFLDSDLSKYLSYFHVTRTGPKTVRIPIDGGPPKGLGSADSLETTLDVEATVSTAPGTALYVYEFPNFSSNAYITDAYNRVVSDNIVDTANSSFGGCETAQVSDAKAWDKIALQASSKGITFHASAGDSGADACGNGSPSVEAPASSPHFAAIGGTSLTVSSKGTWSHETVWNSDGGATGGGISKVFALPSWQKSLAGVSKSGRNLPDVSFDADPNTGIALYYGGSWNTDYNPLGGTSLSSPLFGAALTEVDQYLGKRSGLEAVTLSSVFAKKGYASSSNIVYFHDITSGCNGVNITGYCARKGFDHATGIGSAAWYDILTK